MPKDYIEYCMKTETKYFIKDNFYLKYKLLSMCMYCMIFFCIIRTE